MNSVEKNSPSFKLPSLLHSILKSYHCRYIKFHCNRLYHRVLTIEERKILMAFEMKAVQVHIVPTSISLLSRFFCAFLDLIRTEKVSQAKYIVYFNYLIFILMLDQTWKGTLMLTYKQLGKINKKFQYLGRVTKKKNDSKARIAQYV